MSEARALWDRRLIQLAFQVASWSRDPSTKVGAVITLPNYSVVAVGFNHFPPGVPDTDDHYADRDFKLKHICHAEIDALHQLPEHLAPNCFVYTSFPVCPACVEALGVAGVARIVEPALRADGRDEFWFREWRAKIVESMRLSDEYGIDRRVMHDV
jgi:dCMP deaminase